MAPIVPIVEGPVLTDNQKLAIRAAQVKVMYAKVRQFEHRQSLTNAVNEENEYLAALRALLVEAIPEGYEITDDLDLVLKQQPVEIPHAHTHPHEE